MRAFQPNHPHIMSTTKSVIDNHLNSFGRRDLNGLLGDYATDAILFTPDGPLKGLREIRPFFEALFADFSTPGSRFDLKHLSVDGSYGYIVWQGETAGQVYDLATDTFVVRDGKIAVQSYAGKTIPRH